MALFEKLKINTDISTFDQQWPMFNYTWLSPYHLGEKKSCPENWPQENSP